VLHEIPDQLLKEHGPRQRRGHVGAVELGEAEGRLAEFAVLLLGVGEPLHQAVLMYMLDAATAFARIE